MPETSLPQVIIIRHAEKPSEHNEAEHKIGTDFDGKHTSHGLVPRGWARAGALAALFDRGHLGTDSIRPVRVYATSPSENNRSLREIYTALPIAERLGVEVRDEFGRGDEREMISEILAAGVPTLIVWDHGHIPKLAKHFPLSDGSDIPHHWDDGRFDLVWELIPVGDRYEVTETVQAVLVGDVSDAEPRRLIVIDDPIMSGTKDQE